MTVEELHQRLRRGWPDTKVYVCHYAKRAGQAKPMIKPLAEVRWVDGKLCLVEEDDRKLYLASI